MDSFSFGFETAKFDTFMRSLVSGLRPEVKSRVIRGMALKFIEMVASESAEGVKTPVATGRARAGWIAFADASGVDLNIGGTQSGVAQGKKEGSYEYREEGLNSVYLGIRNGVSYIIWLEYGSSDQAPGGFIRINLRRLRGEVGKAGLDALRDTIAEANVKARAMGLKAK